jgi:hypothetical protein
MIRENHLYKHFKGNTYILLKTAKCSETGKDMVVYQRWITQPTGEVWVRSLSEFQETVEGVPRFRPIRDAYPAPESPDEW